MSTPAIVMLVVAMLILWGGLALSVLNLVKRSPTDTAGRPTAGYDLQRDVHRDL